MPFVVVKCAQTLDGKIATRGGHSKWITAQETRNYTHKLRNDFDAILVGIETVLKDNPHLNATRNTKKIKKVIVDTRLRLPRKAHIFKKTNPADIIIATTQRASRANLKYFLEKGVSIFICPQKNHLVDLKWLFKKLAEQDMASILVEGGSRIIGSVLREHLADKFLFVIAPKIFGDEKAVASVRGITLDNVQQAVRLDKISLKKMGSDILIEGYV